MSIVGIDEVGRGSWAGPLLVVAAQAVDDLPKGLTDSKLLSKSKRAKLFEDISLVCRIGEGWVHPYEIDRHGLAQAMRIGVSRALIMLGSSFDETIIMDGPVNYCPPEFTNVNCVIRADVSHLIVSAASIYAKVKRDEYMVRLSSFFPDYKFASHVGYGTKAHQEMLELHGPSSWHRLSFKPVKAFVNS